MKRLLGFVFALLMALAVAAIVALCLCFQSTPLVSGVASITPADIEQARRIIRTHDPRRAIPGEVRSISLTEQEVDLVVNYAANQFHAASTRVLLQSGSAHIQGSMHWPQNPLGVWLNVDASLREVDGQIEFASLRIGRLPVPAFIADLALQRAMRELNTPADVAAINTSRSNIVQSLRLTDQRLEFVYQWQTDIPDRLRAAFLPQADQDRIKAYSDRLAEITAQKNRSEKVSMVHLLPPMFALAQQRSRQGDAIEENRALMLVLAFYVDRRSLYELIPAAKNWTLPRPLSITLYQRGDFPQHFLISAALASQGGSPLADAIGLHKEVKDAHGGSGFSFNDIAADRAGTRFGELAIKAPQKLQARIAAGIQEGDLMPPVADLPEFMPDAEFRQRFGGVGSAAYNQIMDDIETRLAATPLFRD